MEESSIPPNGYELYHHGIKGQKWGVRNGPPYPLHDGDHSASEKKAASDDKSKATGNSAGTDNKSVVSKMRLRSNKPKVLAKDEYKKLSEDELQNYVDDITADILSRYKEYNLDANRKVKEIDKRKSKYDYDSDEYKELTKQYFVLWDERLQWFKKNVEDEIKKRGFTYVSDGDVSAKSNDVWVSIKYDGGDFVDYFDITTDNRPIYFERNYKTR